MRLPDDRSALLSFIDGSQRFEHAFEPDRRLDETVAEEFFAELIALVASRKGVVFVAELEGAAAGWAVAYPDDNDIYVVPEERTFAYISELYVAEHVRGIGIGRALIAACENWARGRNLRVMMIGVLPGNARAHAIYRRAGYSTYALRLRKYLR